MSSRYDRKPEDPPEQGGLWPPLPVDLLKDRPVEPTKKKGGWKERLAALWNVMTFWKR